MAHDPRTQGPDDGPSMPDVPPGLVPVPIDDDESPRRPEIRRRPDKAVIVVSAILILAIAVLLTMQRCSASSSDSSGFSGSRTIVDVPATQREVGAVSVWVKAGQDPKAVLEGYGIAEGGITVLETDKAVGKVSPAQAAQIVRRLKADSAVQDAGFVMTTDASGAPLPRMATP